MALVADESHSRAAFAAARAMCRREGGAAYLPSFFLPPVKRDGVYALWAFARLIEQAVVAEETAGDCASGTCGSGSRVAPLLKSRIDAMYDAPNIELPLPQFRDASQWVMVAAIDTIRRFEIPRRLWHDLVDGLAAGNALQRVATWRSLDAHLAATGGNIARIVAAVLGATHSDAGDFAGAIGSGVRLTQIIASLKRDLARGRLLLPLEDLARFRYSDRQMLARTVNDNFRSLIGHEIARARERFAQGLAGTCWLAGDGSRMAAAAFVSLQLAALDEIERNIERLLERDDVGGPTRPSLARQLRSLPLAWRIAKRRAVDPLPNLRATRH